MEQAISVQDVSLAFGGRPALHSLTLSDVSGGEFLRCSKRKSWTTENEGEY